MNNDSICSGHMKVDSFQSSFAVICKWFIFFDWSYLEIPNSDKTLSFRCKNFEHVRCNASCPGKVNDIYPKNDPVDGRDRARLVSV
jgi:hypothetical protein